MLRWAALSLSPQMFKRNTVLMRSSPILPSVEKNQYLSIHVFFLTNPRTQHGVVISRPAWQNTHRSTHKHTGTHQHLKMRIFWAADQWGAALLSAWLGPVEGSQNRAHNSLFFFFYLNKPPLLLYIFWLVPVTKSGNAHWFLFDLHCWNCVLQANPPFTHIHLLHGPPYVFPLTVQRLL